MKIGQQKIYVEKYSKKYPSRNFTFEYNQKTNEINYLKSPNIIIKPLKNKKRFHVTINIGTGFIGIFYIAYDKKTNSVKKLLFSDYPAKEKGLIWYVKKFDENKKKVKFSSKPKVYVLEKECDGEFSCSICIRNSLDHVVRSAEIDGALDDNPTDDPSIRVYKYNYQKKKKYNKTSQLLNNVLSKDAKFNYPLYPPVPFLLGVCQVCTNIWKHGKKNLSKCPKCQSLIDTSAIF